MTKKLTWLKDAVIIFAVVLFLLAGIEIALRLMFPEKVEPLAYEFNEDYLIALKPNLRKHFPRNEKNGGEVILWETNSNGFRGAELNPGAKHKIMVYGDSNMQAVFSANANTYAVRLAHYLKNNNFQDIDVINAGIIGFGPDQSLIRFSKEVDIYKPELVIFHVFADNDFGDIVRDRLFTLDENGNLVRSDQKNTVDKFLSMTGNQPRDSHFPRLFIFKMVNKISNDITYNEHNKSGVIRLLQEWCEQEYAIYNGSREDKVSALQDHYDIDIAIHPDAKSAQLKIKLMEGILKKANELALQKGVKFLVLIEPSQIDLTKNNGLIGYEDLARFEHYRRTNLVAPLENMTRSHDVKAINLYDTFLNNQPETLYFTALDNHWNDRGQDLAARETATFITKTWPANSW